MKLNVLLTPLVKFIEKHKKYLSYSLIFLAFLSLGFLFFPDSTGDSGQLAFWLLWVILWIPIFARVFWLKLAQVVMWFRKELWILMWILAFVHGGGYLLHYPTDIWSMAFWIQDGFLSYFAFGFFSLALTLPLLFTSSFWAMRKMWKYWKWLHRSVYFILIFTVAHVVILTSFLHFNFLPLFFLILYFYFKTLEWRGVKLLKTNGIIYPKWQKWICLPCWYIYDPIIGDADSGILPGTEFSDIPDNWRCPECGVSKWDFAPFDESVPLVSYEAKIIQKKFLNPTTIEFMIETVEDLISKPGQYVIFLWKDAEGEFRRSYSIAKKSGKTFTFLIKLTEMGRGAKVLVSLSEWEKIKIAWVFWSFHLQNTKNPKIFIASGTGLAPIYAMINSLENSVDKKLYFTVGRKDELFYVKEIESLLNLPASIHTTKEEVENCINCRVDVDNIEATFDTEFYICGNPNMIQEAKEKLEKKGFQKIYFEEF